MPSVHTVARYVHKADGTGVYIYTPYDPNFVEELKNTVPYYAREWQPSKGKRWFIREDWTVYIDELLHKYFNDVKHEHENETESSWTSTADAARKRERAQYVDGNWSQASNHVAELEQKVAQLERQLRNAELLAENWKRKYDERKAQDFNRAYNDPSNFANSYFSGAQSNSNPDHYAALHITSDAPDEVVRAAYKAMALKYHPDTNGSSVKATKKMQQINNAYDRIKRERNWS